MDKHRQSGRFPSKKTLNYHCGNFLRRPKDDLKVANCHEKLDFGEVDLFFKQLAALSWSNVVKIVKNVTVM